MDSHNTCRKVSVLFGCPFYVKEYEDKSIYLEMELADWRKRLVAEVECDVPGWGALENEMFSYVICLKSINWMKENLY